MPWRIVDYTSADENIERQCILSRSTNMTYRSLNMVINLANELLQNYSGEFVVPDDFKFNKAEKAKLLEDGHIKRSFQIPGTMTECHIYILYVQPYKAPVVPVERRRRSQRVRPHVNYDERWDHLVIIEDDSDEEEDEVEFVEEINPVILEQLRNFHIGEEIKPPVQQPQDIVPRYLLM